MMPHPASASSRCAQAVKYYNAYAKFTGPNTVEATDKKGKVPSTAPSPPPPLVAFLSLLFSSCTLLTSSPHLAAAATSSHLPARPRTSSHLLLSPSSRAHHLPPPSPRPQVTTITADHFVVAVGGRPKYPEVREAPRPHPRMVSHSHSLIIALYPTTYPTTYPTSYSTPSLSHALIFPSGPWR